MRKLLLISASLLALAGTAQAAIIADLGVNPTSMTGTFSNAVNGTTFDDQYTFQLVGGPQFLTVASATNTFAGGATDFITDFSASVFLVGNPIPLIGPVAATDNCGPGCQGFGGSAILDAGDYFLDISGIGGGTSGYGGNLSVAPVPEPATWAMMLLGFLGIGGITMLRRREGHHPFRLA
jgi:hypothetical protein